MPELVLFKRRWHMASDTLPVMMLLLCIVHVVWFIPYATGYWSVESTGLIYDCPQATYLRVANYSLFALFGLAAINEAAIFFVGLRGGPFQTRKRRAVPWLLYVEIALWLLLLGFTIYCTVIVYSPRVQQTCWTNNPCQFADKFPVACRDKSGQEVARLSSDCQFIVDRIGEAACWDRWIKYGLNWMTNATVVFQGYAQEVEAEVGMPIEELEKRDPEDYDEIEKKYNDLFIQLYYNSTEGNKQLCGSGFNKSRWEEVLDLTYDDSYNPRTGNMVITSWNGVKFDTPAKYNQFLDEHENVFAWLNNQLVVALQNATGLSLDVEDGQYEQAAGMPWSVCLDESCQQWLRAADNCTEWAKILVLPSPKDRREFFEVVVISSWSVLAATALVFYFCFNAFPSYDDVDSWEGTVKSLSSLCCMGAALGGSATVGGSELEVSREIAKSLNLLFGGIDMDPTDRLLGVYLVSERQHRRREEDVLRALQDAGYALGPRRSRIGSALSRLTPAGRRRRSSAAGSAAGSGALSPAGTGAGAGPQGASQAGLSAGLGIVGSGKLASCEVEDGAEAPLAVPLGSSGAAAAAAARAAGGPAANGAAKGVSLHGQLSADGRLLQLPGSAALGDQLPPSPFESEATSSGPVLPPSPFEVPSPAAAAVAAVAGASQHALLRGSAAASGGGASVMRSQRPTAQLPGNGRLMLYQRSMLRLRSSVAGALSGGGAAAGQRHGQRLAALEEGRAAQEDGAGATEGEDGGAPAEPETVLEPAGSGSKGGSDGQAAAAPKNGFSWDDKAVRVTSRFHPLLTPSGCAGGARLFMDPPLSPQQAADVYAGQMDRVSFETLHEAQRISRFAVAAYGLQSVIWAKGQRPAMCLANANRLVKCLKKPFGLESKFRKRNFDAIIEMTGVAPSDLLYVSYANVAGGVLPYLIMLHRPSKSVVLSVRGTVSLEDLITDLLSNPVDVADWVPDWVKEEAERRRAAGIAGDASGDSLKAHIGIVSSATAILKDMEERGLLRELLLSKLLRTATLSGRDTMEVVDEFLATFSGALPSVPKPSAAPVQQPGMARAHGAAGTAGPQTAAGAAGISAAEGEALRAAAAAAEQQRQAQHSGVEEAQGEGAGEDETAGTEFKAAEAKLMKRLASLRSEREVELPLERAQTVLRSKLQLRGWKVVVTGHSLGAAVATLLGMQLRERFAELQCWAFNPPGGLLSWELSQIAQAYCTSIVVGKDVISRLSFNTSKRVVDEMVVSLARCTRPKLKIAADVVLGRRARAETTPRTFCAFDEISPESLALVEGYYRTSHLHLQSADTTEMYPPGKIVFLRPFKGKKKAQTVWDAVWIDAATLMSEGILVTPTMMAHHRLFVLADAFKSIFADEVATQAAAVHEQGQDDLLGAEHIAVMA